MSQKRIDTDSDFSDNRCWPYGVGISQTETRLASPRDYLPVEHVAPHELGANCRVVPMAVLVERAARFDKLATRDAAEGAGEPDWAVVAQEAKASSQRVLDDARVDLASTRIPMMSATPKLAPDAMEALRVIGMMAVCEDGETAEQRGWIVDACRDVALNALSAPVLPADGATREAHAQIDALHTLQNTEDRDVNFVLDQLLQGSGDPSEVIKSFRNQIIIASASAGFS